MGLKTYLSYISVFFQSETRHGAREYECIIKYDNRWPRGFALTFHSLSYQSTITQVSKHSNKKIKRLKKTSFTPMV